MNDRKIIEFLFFFFFFFFSISSLSIFNGRWTKSIQNTEGQTRIRNRKMIFIFSSKDFFFFPYHFFPHSIILFRSFDPIRLIPSPDTIKNRNSWKLRFEICPSRHFLRSQTRKRNVKCTEEREEWVSRGGEEEGRNFAKLWAGLVFKFTNSEPEKTCRVQGPGSESPSTTTTTTTKKKRRNEVGGFREISFLNEGP